MNESRKLTSIEGESGLKKDMNSKAILTTDETALEAYKLKMREKRAKDLLVETIQEQNRIMQSTNIILNTVSEQLESISHRLDEIQIEHALEQGG